MSEFDRALADAKAAMEAGMSVEEFRTLPKDEQWTLVAAMWPDATAEQLRGGSD